MSGPRDQQQKQKRQRAQVIAKALRNRDETREKLLAQGRELARRRAENIERHKERRDGSANGTNPSLHATIPSMDSNEEAAARHSHSTVPKRPKGSTVPAARRLYGLSLFEEIRPARDGTSTAACESDVSTDGATESDIESDEGDR